MKKLLVFALFTVIYSFGFCINSTQNILFDVASYELKADEKEKLESISKAHLFLLRGHTDSDGNDEYNIQLSKDRVEAVKLALVKLGIPASKIETAFYGEHQPIRSNQNEADKQLNRRVEILFDNDPLLEREVKIQSFTIKHDIINTVKTNNNIVFTINPLTFQEDVTLEIQEYFDPIDIISAKLSTKTNTNGLLQTGGMFNISAINNVGKKVEIKKSIKVDVSVLKLSMDYKLFEGNRNSGLEMQWDELPTIEGESNTIVSTTTANSTLQKNYNSWAFDQSWHGLHLNRSLDEQKAIQERWVNVSSKALREIARENSNSDLIKYNFEYKIFVKGDQIRDRLEIKNYPNPLALKNNVVHKEIKNHFRQVSLDFLDVENIKLEKYFEHLIFFIKDHQQIDIEIPISNSNAKQKKFIASFNLPQLGWINIDMLLKEGKNAEFFVEIEEDVDLKVLLIKYKSYVLNYSRIEGSSKLTLPMNEPFILIATKIKNGKKLMTLKKLNATNKKIRIMELDDFDPKVAEEKITNWLSYPDELSAKK